MFKRRATLSFPLHLSRQSEAPKKIFSFTKCRPPSADETVSIHFCDLFSDVAVTSTIIHLKHLSAAPLKFLSRSAPMKPDGLITLSTFEYAAGDRSPAAYCFSRLSPFALEPETICGQTAGSLLP